MRKASPSAVRAEAGSATKLTRPARRLLEALAGPGAAAVTGSEGTLVVRALRRGVSLASGSHPAEAGAILVAADLAAWQRDESGSSRLGATAAGLAFLKRQNSPGRQDAFHAQHADLHEVHIEAEDGVARAVVNGSESPLAWLRRRRDRDGEPMIDAAAFEAGERLRRDLTLGGLLPSVTARWDGAVGGGRAGFDPAAATDAALGARQRVRRALDVVGTDFAGLLVDLCGFLKGLETIERERRWPARSAKVVVRLALGRLAEHYGLRREARGPARSVGTRVWLAADQPSA